MGGDLPGRLFARSSACSPALPGTPGDWLAGGTNATGEAAGTAVPLWACLSEFRSALPLMWATDRVAD